MTFQNNSLNDKNPPQLNYLYYPYYTASASPLSHQDSLFISNQLAPMKNIFPMYDCAQTTFQVFLG